MDKLNKLQSLLGEDQVSTGGDSAASPWAHVKAEYIYEGTDSEDDEDIMSGRASASLSYFNPIIPGASGPEVMSSDVAATETANADDQQLTIGDLAAEGEFFCPWLTVKKYPYAYVGIANRKAVAEDFFDQGKIFDRPWDFFYIHREGSDPKLSAILLVPTKQFQALLDDINQTLYTELTIPLGGANRVFQLTFANDGNPRPRYLGRSITKDMAENLRSAIPPAWFKVPGEVTATEAPSDRSLEAFKAKIGLMTQAAKGRKVLNKEKQKVERIAKQQGWSHSTKRVQRYLGLRQASQSDDAAQANCENPGSEWKADIPRSADFDPDNPAPYNQEGEVVFVCVDVEANERNSSQITEIGIATLDTRDLKKLIPGAQGAGWHRKIRARHFRIEEYKHIVNSEFVTGCPDRFEFGESEFIKLKAAPQAVAACFKPPFSNPDENAIIDENETKRNIILVGHGLGADVTYLRNLGYDVHNLSNLQELVDTSTMWQALRRDANPRNLGSVLAELDIVGWNLHNAGNDAVYTLQAMIGISVKLLYEREKRKEDRALEKKVRVEESIKEATQNALDREEGWSSAGNDSDGGVPIAPVPPGTKKPTIQQARKRSQYSQGPWRNPDLNSGNGPLSQRNDGSWQRTATNPERHPSASNGSWRGRGSSVRGSSRGGITPTASLQFSDSSSRDVVDLVNKTKLFTIEIDEHAKEQ